MLVLTLKPGESATIGDDIVVTALEVRGYNLFRIGFDAPKNIRIMRTELLERPQIELGYDKTLDCGSLGHVTPNPIVAGIESGTKDDDEYDPTFMRPIQKVGHYARHANDNKPATGSVRGGDVPKD